jgi:hypothetical protein
MMPITAKVMVAGLMDKRAFNDLIIGYYPGKKVKAQGSIQKKRR